MTEHRLHQLLRAWRHRLGLDQWHLELRVAPTSEADSKMEITRSTTYDRAIITVNPWMLHGGPIPEGVLEVQLTDELVEISLVHELLHCHTRDLRYVTDEPLDGLVTRDVHDLVNQRMTHEEERVVDRLAVALVKAWP